MSIEDEIQQALRVTEPTADPPEGGWEKIEGAARKGRAPPRGELGFVIAAAILVIVALVGAGWKLTGSHSPELAPVAPNPPATTPATLAGGTVLFDVSYLPPGFQLLDEHASRGDTLPNWTRTYGPREPGLGADGKPQGDYLLIIQGGANTVAGQGITEATTVHGHPAFPPAQQ